MVIALDYYSEGLRFESQLDPGFFFCGFISHSFNKNNNYNSYSLLSLSSKKTATANLLGVGLLGLGAREVATSTPSALTSKLLLAKIKKGLL